MSSADALDAVVRAISGLPAGPLRDHFTRAVASAPTSPVPTPSAAAAVAAAPSFSTSLAARLADTSHLPPSAAYNRGTALALALHAACLDAGLVCTGAEDTPPGASFAAPHRPVRFAPDGWAHYGQDGPFHFRYQREGRPPTTFFVAANVAGEELLVRATSSARAVSELRLPIPHFLGAAEFASRSCADALASLSAVTPAAFAELCARVRSELLRPLAASPLDEAAALGAAGWGGDAGGGLRSAPRGSAPPLTGRVPGDFDSDLYPDLRGAVPGSLLDPSRAFGDFSGARQPGNLVGPGHPLFDGRGGELNPFGGGGGARLPLGVPPGARFDPFLPPGVGPVGGLRGPRGGFPGGPSPDHLAPPPDAPPDIYY